MHTVRVAPARLFLQWREYFVGITSSEVAAVLRKWRTEGQRTILRAGMIIDLSSTRSPPQPNPTHDVMVTNVNYFHGDVCLRSLKSYPHGISPLILEMRERLKRVMNKSTAKRGNSIEEQSLHKFI